MTIAGVQQRATDPAFRHEALFYDGSREFHAAALSFIRDGLARGEPVMVAVSAAKITGLRRSLGADAGRVRFADMAQIGTNPARIIPAWRAFVSEHAGAGRPVRGIGEPAWAGRSPAELIECQAHEALLNRAFAGSPPWWLLCPYDTRGLSPAVITDAQRSHPVIRRGGVGRPSPSYGGFELSEALVGQPLPEPAAPTEALSFGPESLAAVRQFVAGHAAEAGLGPAATGDLVLAVNELATNSVRHGGGAGTVRSWRNGDALICEVSDRGRLGDLLVGREAPDTGAERGRGLWLVNQLCPLVQIRSSATGTVVRLHMRDRPA